MCLRLVVALLALALPVACTAPDREEHGPDDRPLEAVGRTDVDAIIEGMMRAREDRLRREVRRMMAPGAGRPPG